MSKQLSDRLAALEQRRGEGPNHIVILFGVECDAFDAAYNVGDYEGALAVLVRNNRYVPEEVLREYFLHAPAQEPIYPGTLIRAEYGEIGGPS